MYLVELCPIWHRTTWTAYVHANRSQRTPNSAADESVGPSSARGPKPWGYDLVMFGQTIRVEHDTSIGSPGLSGQLPAIPGTQSLVSQGYRCQGARDPISPLPRRFAHLHEQARCGGTLLLAWSSARLLAVDGRDLPIHAGGVYRLPWLAAHRPRQPNRWAVLPTTQPALPQPPRTPELAPRTDRTLVAACRLLVVWHQPRLRLPGCLPAPRLRHHTLTAYPGCSSHQLHPGCPTRTHSLTLQSPEQDDIYRSTYIGTDAVHRHLHIASVHSLPPRELPRSSQMVVCPRSYACGPIPYQSMLA